MSEGKSYRILTRNHDVLLALKPILGLPVEDYFAGFIGYQLIAFREQPIPEDKLDQGTGIAAAFPGVGWARKDATGATGKVGKPLLKWRHQANEVLFWLMEPQGGHTFVADVIKRVTIETDPLPIISPDLACDWLYGRYVDILHHYLNKNTQPIESGNVVSIEDWKKDR